MKLRVKVPLIEGLKTQMGTAVGPKRQESMREVAREGQVAK